MASQDIYVRKDVYEADQRALITEIKLMHNELLTKIDEKFEAFKVEVDKRFEAIKERIDGLQTEIRVLTTRVEGIENRITDSHNLMMIGFGVLGFLIVFVGFIRPLSRLFRLWSISKRVNAVKYH